MPEDDCLGNTRKGKQVLNVAPPDAACAFAVVEGELVAAIGENRKMVIFPLEQVPEMARGRGVRLQRYKDGSLSDLKTFKTEDGLTWTDTAGRAFTLTLKSSPTGAATAPTPGGWRRKDSRAATPSASRRRTARDGRRSDCREGNKKADPTHRRA